MTEHDILALIRAAQVGAYGDDEALFMAATFLDVWPDHVFDWGTNIGCSARIFWTCADATQNGAAVHTIELPDNVPHVEHPGAERYAMLLDGLPVRKYRGDGATVACDLIRDLKPTAPLLFVDGDHGTETIHRELTMIAEAAPHAVILVHDTRAEHTDAGLQRFLDDGHAWDHELLESQAGMSRLWPRLMPNG